jgi:hypothetical protein
VNSNEQDAVQIRATPRRPVTDSDGNWVEYGNDSDDLRNLVAVTAVRFLDANSGTLFSGSSVAKEAQAILATLAE